MAVPLPAAPTRGAPELTEHAYNCGSNRASLMNNLAHVGDVLSMHARLHPHKIGARDLEREMTFRVWRERAARLANALLGIGLAKGDRVCVLAYNCIEWLEIYAATAMAGLIAVPINFRLGGREFQYIVENCEAKAFIVQDELLGEVEAVRADLPVPAHELHCLWPQTSAGISRLRGSDRARPRRRAGCRRCAARTRGP